MSILDAHKAGYAVDTIARLCRDGYSYHQAVGAWFMFDDDPDTGESVCRMTFRQHQQIKTITTRGYTSLNAKKKAIRERDRLRLAPESEFAKAVNYGFNGDAVQRLIDRGYKYEYGVFVRREKVAPGHYRVKTAFLMDGGQLRETLACADNGRKAMRRAYSYIKRIRQHGSLISSFHYEADLAQRKAA